MPTKNLKITKNNHQHIKISQTHYQINQNMHTHTTFVYQPIISHNNETKTTQSPTK